MYFLLAQTEPTSTQPASTQPSVTDDAAKLGDAMKSGDPEAIAQSGYELFVTWGIPAITAIVILIVAYFVGKFLARLASAPVKKRVDETLGAFVAKLVFYLIMVFAVLGVLSYFGIGVASFAAVLAAAGFAVGLAFQGSLSNFAAGVMLLVFRPFKVGDVCRISGELVKIAEIDLFTTLANTLDNRRIIFPNSDVFGSQIEVITFHPQRRVEVAVGASYDADIDATRAALEAAIAATPDTLDDPEPMVVLQELGDSSVNWSLWVWAEAANFLAVKQGLLRNAKLKLDEAGIGIPYPQMDVHVDGKLGD